MYATPAAPPCAPLLPRRISTPRRMGSFEMPSSQISSIPFRTFGSLQFLVSFLYHTNISINRSYSADGRFIFSRDYLSVKVWDVNMESSPVDTIMLHDHLHPLLEDLYESDSIFDKFEICCRSDGKSFATGSYRYSPPPPQHF